MNHTKTPAAPPLEVGKKKKPLSPAMQMVVLTLGVVIVALGIHFFKFPNHFAMGGVAGISVILGRVLPGLTPALSSFVLNMALLVLGLIVFGRHFAIRTVYATTLLSILQLLLERWIPLAQPLTNDALLELLFAIFCSAFGSAMIFNQGASTGGTDILAMIVRKYSSLDIGKALLVTDLAIGASTFFIFDVKTGLYSICGIVLKGVMVDSLIQGFNRVKYFTIVCSQPEAIERYITQTLRRTSTRLRGQGVYSGDDRTVLLCVVDRMQAVLLMDYVRAIDPHAFVMVTNTSEIVGRGFHAAV